MGSSSGLVRSTWWGFKTSEREREASKANGNENDLTRGLYYNRGLYVGLPIRRRNVEKRKACSARSEDWRLGRNAFLVSCRKSLSNGASSRFKERAVPDTRGGYIMHGDSIRRCEPYDNADAYGGELPVSFLNILNFRGSCGI